MRTINPNRKSRSKKIGVGYYFSAEVIEMVDVASKAENRSKTNLVETAVIEYCRRHYPGSDLGRQPGSGADRHTGQ